MYSSLTDASDIRVYINTKKGKFDLIPPNYKPNGVWIKMLWVLVITSFFSGMGLIFYKFYVYNHVASYFETAPTTDCVVVSVNQYNQKNSIIYQAKVSYTDVNGNSGSGSWYMTSNEFHEYPVGSSFKCFYTGGIQSYDSVYNYVQSQKGKWWQGVIIAGLFGIVNAAAFVCFALPRNGPFKYSFPEHLSYRDSMTLSINTWGEVPQHIRQRLYCVLCAYYSEVGVFPAGGITFSGKLQTTSCLVLLVVMTIFGGPMVGLGIWAFKSFNGNTITAGLLGFLIGLSLILLGCYLTKGHLRNYGIFTESLSISYQETRSGGLSGSISVSKKK